MISQPKQGSCFPASVSSIWLVGVAMWRQHSRDTVAVSSRGHSWWMAKSPEPETAGERAVNMAKSAVLLPVISYRAPERPIASCRF